MTARLFTVGEVLAVFVVDDALPLAEATRFRRIVAGSESNVAAGFVRLGHSATLATAVGADALGDAVEASLRSWGIDTHARRSDRSTGSLVRSLAGTGPFDVVHLRTESAATTLSPTDVHDAWPADVDVVFVTGITAVRSESARRAVEHTVSLAKQQGALVVVDPNLRARLAPPSAFAAALAPVRNVADVAIGDAAELALLAGGAPQDAARALLDAGCRLVVVKHGAAGAWASDGVTEHFAPSRATAVVDSVGAGDAFAAGVIAGIVEGAGVRDVLELATGVAAPVVATAGDVEGFPRARPQPNDEIRGSTR